MGLLRFLLATSVVFSHLGSIRGFDLIGGWRAVQVFYLVSGFYMALVLDTKYRQLPYRTFITSRVLRLFPAYYLMILFFVARVAWAYFREVPCGIYIPHCGEFDLNPLTLAFLAFTSIALIGKDWLFFLTLTPTGAVRFTTHGYAEPLGMYGFGWDEVSWTLGIELTFYLLAPWLLRKRTSVLLSVVAMSVGARAYAYWGLGLVNDPWTYRFFPFELAFFLIGALMYRWYRSDRFAKLPHLDRWCRAAWLGMMSATVAFFPIAAVLPAATLWYYGLAFACLPFIFHLTRNLKWDRQWGELSYPLYLFHVPVGWLVARAISPHPLVGYLVSVGVAILVERWLIAPIDRFRSRRLVTDAERLHHPPIAA